MYICYEMRQEEINLNNCTIRIEHDILYTEFKPDTHLTIDGAKEIVATRLKFADGAMYKMVVDTTNLVKVDFAVRKYLASHEGYEGIEKLAIIAKSKLSRMLVNFFLKIDTPVKPTLAFTSIEKAQLWLKGLLML